MRLVAVRAMALRRNQESPNNTAASAPRMMNGSAELDVGNPRTAWSNRIWMYQRSGSSAPQKRAKAPIASSGKPTPAKPKAGLQKMAVRLKPTASSRVKSCNRLPSER